MTTHSRLSPSSRIRWANCPASVRESAKYPERPSGPAAIDGTHTHTLLERCIKAGSASAKPSVGITLKDHEGEFVVSAEQADRVDVALNYINSRLTEILMTDGAPAKVYAETRVDPQFLLGRPDLGGTVDVQIHSRSMVEIVDYKDGMQPVDARDNMQLEMYAIGVLAGYKLPINVEYPVQTIRMTIIQPKMTAKGLPAITSHDVSVSTLLSNISVIVTQAAATDREDAPFVPGEAQCKYCAAKGSCTALVNQSMESAGISFQNLDVAKDAANKEPTEMSDQQIKEIVEAAPLIRSMIEAVEAEALRRFEAGKSIEGLKAVRGRGARSWVYGDDEIAEKLKKMGLPKDVIWNTKVISPAQIEKVSWKATKAGEEITKTISERQMKVIQNEYIKKSEGKITIASDSDPRPAVTLNAAPMFAPVADALPSWMV